MSERNPSQDMVDRVANAIWRALGPPKATPHEVARAAIEALREPTEAMLDAARNTGLIGNEMGTGDLLEVWQAAINEALK